jgi:hypothetical protein
VQIAFAVDRAIYEASQFHKPPQVAVWIESEDGRLMRTLHVSGKTGSGDWGQKPDCPVCLPYWVARMNRASGTVGAPTRSRPAPDAITHPTVTAHAVFKAEAPEGTRWRCFIEVNASGDFNAAFPERLADGSQDIQGNGQPSLVYRADLKASAGQAAAFELAGRTDQWPMGRVELRDVEGVTTARHLLVAPVAMCVGERAE